MNEQEVLTALRAITAEHWRKVLAKCYTHIEIRLYKKTLMGAHCEQRLGMSPFDFYCGEAVQAIYNRTWEWKYGQFSLEEQLIRIIDSMISEQVRKYKVEKRHNKNTTLVENSQLVLAIENDFEEDEDDGQHLKKLTVALELACENNEKYKRFVSLKKQKLNYDEICTELGCTINEAYQLMENISRRAKKILKSL